MQFRIALAAAAFVAAVPAAVSAPMAMAQENAADAASIRAVQAHVDAYRSGNLDRFVATFAPDAVVTANGMTAVGRAQIKQMYALNFGPGAPGIRIDDSGMSGGNVYLSVAYTFADGTEVCCSYSEYQVKGGKIASLTAY
ncbi:nuclear transport factor 2 family protein [Erythrobacter sp. MTPC3]|uniref:nuclear transport factor 2 family protein n=1 Tax=Erythrobacter sp. MTPC3 TaxID=3056564 RepID=UPI0036F2454D